MKTIIACSLSVAFLLSLQAFGQAPLSIPLYLDKTDDDQRYQRLVTNFTFGTYENPLPYQSDGRIQFTTMDLQGIFVGEARANATLDLDNPYLYDLNKSLTAREVTSVTEDFYVTDANKAYSGIRAVDTVCIKAIGLCKNMTINPIIDVKRRNA